MQELHPIIKELLEKRGIVEEADVQEFLSMKPQKTYDPFLMKGMKEGVAAILTAIASGQKICIYGDYDCDGVTSTSIMMSILRELTDHVTYYLPSRFTDGYGLNKDAIARIYDEGSRFLLTVDCGSVSKEEVAFAKDLGMEVLITDHHTWDETGEKVPDTIVINPHQPGCEYPFKDLAGCGVAYKLAQALQRTKKLDRGILARILDFVAIGTIGDIVPLVDENRTLVKYGLYELNRGQRESLKVFAGIAGTPVGTITSENVSFGLVPRINAAGRMETADVGVKLLLSEDKNEMQLNALMLQGYNEKRKELQEETYQRCLALMEEQCPNALFPIIDAGEAHEGITGIVAGKLRERCGKPVVLVTPTKDDCYKGTGRCIESLNLYDVLKKHDALFTKFGGHKGACGFTMPMKNLDKLRKGVQEDLEKLDPAMLVDPITFDMDLVPGQADLTLAKTIATLEPFGQDNANPVFRMQNVRIKAVRYMGKDEQHVRLLVEDISSKETLNVVFFGRAQEYKELLQIGKIVTVYGSLSVNVFRDTETVQMIASEITE